MRLDEMLGRFREDPRLVDQHDVRAIEVAMREAARWRYATFGKDEFWEPRHARLVLLRDIRLQLPAHVTAYAASTHGGARSPYATVPHMPQRETPKERRKRIIAANLRQFREARGWTQEQLAYRIDVRPEHVSRWENRVHEVYPDSMDKLCEVFGVFEHEFYVEPAPEAASA